MVKISHRYSGRGIELFDSPVELSPTIPSDSTASSRRADPPLPFFLGERRLFGSVSCRVGDLLLRPRIVLLIWPISMVSCLAVVDGDRNEPLLGRFDMKK